MVSLTDSPLPAIETETAFEGSHSPSVTPLQERIAEQARQRPNGLALAMDAKRATYADLERRASKLANYLKPLGLGPEVLVAICLERSPEFVVAALAVLKCGAAYLPIDPAHPVDRLRFIIKDATAHLLLTESKFRARFDGCGIGVVALDTAEPAINQQTDEWSAVDSQPDHLAYVIYTSGSTGQPKGVEITHWNLANLVDWHVGAFALDASARATFQAGVGFDAAVWEMWPALSVGAELHLPNEEMRVSAEGLRDWFVGEKITHTFVPTAMAEQLLALPWPNETKLRFLLTGADTLHRFPPAGLPFFFVNNYGPTECTVVTTSAVIPPGSEGIPSIGAPIDNVSVRMIDGEIIVGGAGVGRGYRNRPDLTAERFIISNDERWYRTGDLGRELPSGEIEFLGRLDDQIKIRGYRIELNEINAVLNQMEAVQASVVVLREDSPNEKKLVAYVVPANSVRDEAELRQAIAQRLPDYMMPSAFVWLESLPLTTNGKVDRVALPPPGPPEKEFIGPRTPVEEKLVAIISDVLKVPRVSVDDDFFHLGAHSLLGAQIIARVRGVFGAELKLLDVFDAPTVAKLALKIEETLTQKLNAMSEAEVEAALAALNAA